MRWRSLLAIGLVTGLVVSAAGPLGAQDTRPGIAVFPFENGGSYGQDAENFEALQVGLQQMLTTEFAVNPGLRVVDRSQIRALMQEQDLGASGRVDANTAARIGKLVGARYAVLGGFVDFYGDFRLDIRIVNVETSEIVRTEKVRKKREDLYDIVVESAVNITQNLDLPALPAGVREARESREVPTEAVTYYTRGLLYAERGNTERAAELFARAKEIFPAYTEVDVALQQMGRS
jgi:TolB-like protein